MRTITVEKTLYKFDELESHAKQIAKDKHAAIMGYAWRKEAMASIEKLAEYFGGKVSDWQIDWFNRQDCSMSFSMPEMEDIGNDNLSDNIHRAIGTSDATEEDVKTAYIKWVSKKLDSLGTFDPVFFKGDGDCSLTGYCHDENAIDGFRIAFMRDGYEDLTELMNRAYRSWIKACCDDCDDQYSDEQFSEMCEANGYEFLENGKLA